MLGRERLRAEDPPNRPQPQLGRLRGLQRQRGEGQSWRRGLTWYDRAGRRRRDERSLWSRLRACRKQHLVSCLL